MMGIRPGKQMSKAGTSWVKWVQVQNKPMWTYEVIHIYAFFSLIELRKEKAYQVNFLYFFYFCFLLFILFVVLLFWVYHGFFLYFLRRHWWFEFSGFYFCFWAMFGAWENGRILFEKSNNLLVPIPNPDNSFVCQL